ncbi:unnamed protein product [Zymoseptoria tritici ST99CH_3D1]|uniref:Aminotransferase class V domain-containing protein n=1 Tax=Zymoseptoria tritici (strain CBS 115943 / IPO323) TaxID=336722 RepID=F9XKR8_ZYMTI|nr:uncharacterized protein MYCGRDRAFT_76295 [Zymoseptoria tritici IPO323]EGP83842.1 hypothetical protein MYCGRDRAFT_76295 [Zymoseptoria tritici IPO323]SMR62956.1 unnamed protein product [Zymoseptoria tritici ST99CH_3D1]
MTGTTNGTYALRPAEAKHDQFSDVDSIEVINCGEDAAKHFLFDPQHRNLNHGSFGTYPKAIKTVFRHFQDQCESRPDWFLRYELPQRINESRTAIAEYLNAPVEACVFVPNATTGVNAVLRNLVFQPGEVIIYFATIYGACQKSVEYILETTPAEARQVEYTYPCSDDDLCAAFEKTVQRIKAEGKTPKVAIFDTIVSLPGVRVPFERLTKLCREHNVLSLIDGAHSVGHIPMDLNELDPDFYVSNCHKWLFVPRGCAVFFVPDRNQHLMRSSLPTSHGFVPRGSSAINNPLPPSAESEFVTQFGFTGTLDFSAYMCVPAALKWRSKVAHGNLRGEEAILAYCQQLAKDGGKLVADAFDTKVMENQEGTLGQCNLVNVPLTGLFEQAAGSDAATASKIVVWMAKTLTDGYNTFIAMIVYNNEIVVRLSSEIYLTLADFEWAAKTLKEVCERVRNGEWKTPQK